MVNLHDVGHRCNVGEVVLSVVEVERLKLVADLPALHRWVALRNTLSDVTNLKNLNCCFGAAQEEWFWSRERRSDCKIVCPLEALGAVALGRNQTLFMVRAPASREEVFRVGVLPEVVAVPVPVKVESQPGPWNPRCLKLANLKTVLDKVANRTGRWT